MINITLAYENGENDIDLGVAEKKDGLRCAIWYHLHNLKNMKNTHGEVLILVKLQAKPATLLKLALLYGCFSRF